MTRPSWTAEDVAALGVRTDLITACDLVYQVGRTKAFEMYHLGELDFPVLKCGRRISVPVAPLLALLGLEPTGAPNG